MRSACDVSTVSMNEATQAAEAAATDEWRGEQRQTDRHTDTDRISDTRQSSVHPLSKRHFSRVYRI